MTENRAALNAFWRQEEQRPFQGWDFSYIKDRMIEDPTPWSYEALVRELMAGATAVLDTSTGGGEKLLSFRDVWPPIVKATEGYAPNLKLARETLASLGVEVLFSEGGDEEILPFADETFDLVINRHGGINGDEVARVLKPGGTFLTQQVDGMSEHDLIAVFTDTGPQWPDANLERYTTWLRQAGLQIVRAEHHHGRETFRDVGAIVYHLKAIPWLVEGFSVDRYLPQLLQLQDQLEAGRPLTFSNQRYLIQAYKG